MQFPRSTLRPHACRPKTCLLFGFSFRTFPGRPNPAQHVGTDHPHFHIFMPRQFVWDRLSSFVVLGRGRQHLARPDPVAQFVSVGPPLAWGTWVGSLRSLTSGWMIDLPVFAYSVASFNVGHSLIHIAIAANLIKTNERSIANSGAMSSVRQRKSPEKQATCASLQQGRRPRKDAKSQSMAEDQIEKMHGGLTSWREKREGRRQDKQDKRENPVNPVAHNTSTNTAQNATQNVPA